MGSGCGSFRLLIGMAVVDLDDEFGALVAGGDGDMPMGDAREAGRTKSSIFIGSADGDPESCAEFRSCDMPDGRPLAARSLNLWGKRGQLLTGWSRCPRELARH